MTFLRSSHYFKALHLWSVLLSSLVLSAQNDHQPYFRNYSTDDGLPSPEVHDILQDRQGYLWIATDNGVSRFDGYRFHNYGAKQGLMNNVVFFLEEDSHGRVWMQTMSGNMYYYDQDSIHTYAHNDIFGQYRYFLPNGFMIPEGKWHYFSLIHLGILRVDSTGRHDFLNRNTSSMLVLLEKPELKRSLFSIVGNATLQQFGFPVNTSPTNHQLAVFSDSLNGVHDVYLKPGTTRSSGFSEGQHQLFDFRKELVIYQNYELVSRFPIPSKAAEIDRIDSTFWVGLNNKEGVWAFPSVSDLHQGRYQRYLKGNSISAVYRDNLGGHWFGTLEDGLRYAPNLDLRVIRPEILSPNENILCLQRGSDGQLLLGTDAGQIYALDTTGNFQKLQKIEGGVYDLRYTTNDRTLWVTGQPLQMIRGGKRKPVPYADALSRAELVSSKRILPSADSSRIYCLSSIGLEVVDRSAEQVVFSTLGTTYQTSFLDAFEDSGGRIWIGSTRGLLEFSEDQLRPVVHREPFFQLRIEAINELADGTLVMGSKGGGIALWKDAQVTILDDKAGLTSNMIESIIIDDEQQIWVATLNGLNVVRRDSVTREWSIRQVTMSHGLPSNEIHDLCHIGNWLYIATGNGLVRFPLKQKITRYAPAPFFETILVNGQPVDQDQLGRLKYNEGNIQLHFICLNYKFRENIPYRYKLNADAAWSYTRDRSVNYAALTPGNYTFELQAQNEDGAWSESLIAEFSISRPFWQRLWFRLGAVAFLLFGGIYYWYRVRLTRLRKEALTEKQINELHRSALQAQMNPHFIFNCLNSIQSFIASGDKTSAMHYLARFAKLVRATLNASTQASISLEEEVQVLKNYIELEKLRFHDRFEYTIEIDPELDPFEISLPPLLVQPFVENAINHGFNFTDPTRIGDLRIRYQKAGGYLRVSIRDNGLGIDRSQQHQANATSIHQLMGMSITQKRLSLQGAPAGDHLQVEELKDEANNTAGTEVVIRIKI
ncbi:sensor histidine kinase [Flavilitoribacter nigricans]|uniref:Signal transduction histidine kinase internal region domain-containing protein n=1 Tax=Flavilitoribacter nigricans (strain ATCC 23147 / DSM 23189 / NBRC 102662 / NCIMB 1420 / SS-2) TaxID=1122177 RepID=A0A2D0NHN9_FLAN2|nr:histidine kinase [Flavilitoribacter nigricans]PHN07283.1 hypothetical protein CRP01_06540 [Flavilitoribacter nigricans DSM 23189 = NBRC 102662]